MILKSTPILLAASLLALAAVPAHAQSSDSATVDAIAHLVTADQPLSLTAVSALNFGQVVIPAQGNVTCTYEIRGDGNLGVRQGGTDYGLAPTPAGCTFRDGNAARATLTLLCEADRLVAISLRSQTSGIQGNAVVFETFDDFLEVDGQERYDWNQNCTGRDMTLRLGGRLAIQGEARPTGEGVEVGSVTIEAFYP